MGYLCAECGRRAGGGIRQQPTFPRERRPAWPVTCVGAEGEGEGGRVGWPLRVQGTDGAGLRSQGPALLREVELVPSAGGWQCLSGLAPLPEQLPTWGGGAGVPRLWNFLVMGPLPKHHGVEAGPSVGLEKPVIWQR